MRRSLITFVLTVVLAVVSSQSLEAQEVRRYVRYLDGDNVWWGMVDGSQIRQLTSAPYLGGGFTGVRVERSAVHLKAPVDPENVYMTALNFRSHIGGEPAPYPGLFLVPPGSIIGPDEPMIHPSDSRSFHYEAEAIVVIGKDCENVPVESAGDCIYGVTIGNDGSARDWQGADIQWARAKGSKGFNPVGPELVTGVDYHDIQITGRLNGEVVQGESTSDMVYDFDDMVSYISRYFPLKAGDLIWSGTMGQTRPLSPGDIYEVELEGIGILRNPIVMGQ